MNDLVAKKAKLLVAEKGKKVQDVGFRLYLLKEAQKRFITHFFAENLPDGKTVEILISGTPDAVDRFIAMVRKLGQMPQFDFEITADEYRGSIIKTSEFASYLTAEQLVTGIGVLGGLNDHMDCMGKNIEHMGKNIEHMGENVEHMTHQLDELPHRIALEIRKA